MPIPEDPDQAFSDYGGLLISVARWTVPILLSFGDEISGMEGAVRNGADVDRWLLSDLDRPRPRRREPRRRRPRRPPPRNPSTPW